MVASDLSINDFEPTDPGDLLGLLAADEHLAAGLDPDLAEELAARLQEHLEQVVELTAPETAGDRASWLLEIEGFARALQNARHLAQGGVSWAQRVVKELDPWLEKLAAAAGAMSNAWEIGALVEKRLAGERASLRPWSLLAGKIGKDAVAGAEPVQVVRAWAENRLAGEAANWLAEQVCVQGPWRDAYRDYLSRAFGPLTVFTYPAILAGEPFLELRLLHLGPETRLTAQIVSGGTAWRWPGREPLHIPWNQHQVEIPGDEATGTLRFQLNPLPPSSLQVASRIAERALETAEAERVDEKALEELSELLVTELGDGKVWRRELERAVEVYEKGLELDDDEESKLVEWVRYALEARLGLDRAAFRIVHRPALRLLAQLDTKLATLGNSVMLLDDDEYRELLAGQDAPAGTWWARRREIEASIPDEGINSLLVELGEESARQEDIVPGRSLAWLRDLVNKLSEQFREAVLRRPPFPRPRMASAIGAVAIPHFLFFKRENSLDFEALDGSWQAFAKVGKSGQEELVLLFRNLPAEAKRVFLVGLEQRIERKTGETPKARFRLEEVEQRWEEKGTPTIVVVLEYADGEQASVGRLVQDD